MSILFHVIGSQLNAFRAAGGGTATLITDTASNSDAAIITDATSGVFSSKLIQMTHTTSFRGVQWPGGANMPSSAGPFTVRVRIQPRFTGAPVANTVLWCAEGIGMFNTNTCWFYLDTTSKLNFLLKDTVKGTTFVNVTTSAAISPTLTSGTPVEFMAAWGGLASAGDVAISMNGVQVGTTLTATAATAAWNNAAIVYMMSGGSARFAIGNYDLNELLTYNSKEATTYTPNSAFVTDTAFDASIYSDPTVAKVIAPTTYTFAGNLLTGTATAGGGYSRGRVVNK